MCARCTRSSSGSTADSGVGGAGGAGAGAAGCWAAWSDAVPGAPASASCPGGGATNGWSSEEADEDRETAMDAAADELKGLLA